MGHSERGRSVHERYGHISDEELLEAIDRMTFDHGETVIMVAGKKGDPLKSGRKMVENPVPKEKRPRCLVT
jgi:hypothetical protein